MMSYIGMKELEQVPVVPQKGMKGPLSYDNCKDCRSRCEHAGKDRTFLYRDKSCKITVVTRADRLRAMTDEELAAWLARQQIVDVANACAVLGVQYTESPDTHERATKEALQWLQQPAEE